MENILERLQEHDPRWIIAFMELAKLYKEATPEQRKAVLDILEEHKGITAHNCK